MTKEEMRKVFEIIDNVKYGEVTIKKENGNIVLVSEKHTRKLNLHRSNAQGEKNGRPD